MTLISWQLIFVLIVIGRMVWLLSSIRIELKEAIRLKRIELKHLGISEKEIEGK